MSKKILIVACLVIMTTVFSGCDLLGGDKNKEAAKEGINNTEQNQENNKENESGSGDGNYFETMQDLMARGKSMKCTYTQEVEGGGTATGVVYMADKNARTEITIKEANSPFGKMYALVNQEWVYSWNDTSSEGYKIALEASEMGEKNKETVSNLSEEIDFECKSWKKDNSKFKVPTNIEFKDMSEMMEGFEDMDLGEELENAEIMGDEFLCEICKNAPDPEDCLGGVVCDWSK